MALTNLVVNQFTKEMLKEDSLNKQPFYLDKGYQQKIKWLRNHLYLSKFQKLYLSYARLVH